MTNITSPRNTNTRVSCRCITKISKLSTQNTAITFLNLNTKTTNMDEFTPPKKIKLSQKVKKNEEPNVRREQKIKQNSAKDSKFLKNDKKGGPINVKEAKVKKFLGKTVNSNVNFNKNSQNSEKVEDWVEFKKKKKELKLKRKQGNNVEYYDVVCQAKKMGEILRRKTMQGGEENRSKLINKLHDLLKQKGHYAKFVLAHDTARLVQWLLKYSSDIVVQQISAELIPATVVMLQSKYGIFCVKRLLKYGNAETKSKIIDSMYGHAVKLTSHAISAPIIEYAYSNFANPKQKCYLIQEFFGDLYRNSKDDSIKHIRDVYKNDESLKKATLGATKANLTRILNKNLLDSGLVQSVLYQFLTECSEEDKKEIISQLSKHIVVISNSKDGSRTAMLCIWHGSNKDRKVIMKTLKENIIELSKHEHGHCTVITLLDSTDDTVLLQKIILSDILNKAKDLAISEWGRKVLLWLVAPDDKTKFHPIFLNELKKGLEASTSKKPREIRRKEILDYSISNLLSLIVEDAKFWLSNASLATEMTAIVRAGTGENLKQAYESLAKVICDLDWKIKENKKEILGIEHAGMHMTLKKLAKNDEVNLQNGNPTFGATLAQEVTSDTLKVWLELNRGCFFLLTILDNATEETRDLFKDKLKPHLNFLKMQTTAGAKLLLEKLR